MANVQDQKIENEPKERKEFTCGNCKTFIQFKTWQRMFYSKAFQPDHVRICNTCMGPFVRNVIPYLGNKCENCLSRGGREIPIKENTFILCKECALGNSDVRQERQPRLYVCDRLQWSV